MRIKLFKNKSEIGKVLDLFIKVYSEAPYNDIWNKDSAFKKLSEIYERGKDFCFYTKDKGEIIGLLFCQTPTWHDGVHVFVEDIVVDSNYRNKKIGAQLVKKLEQTAKQKHIVSIDLLASTDSRAPDFWKNLGYKPVGYIELGKMIKK
jgi:N-acetylglutamate synthase-like GNAT family acetyltransferase